MAKKLIRDVELWYAKVKAGEEENRFEPTNPKWGVQIRSRTVKKEDWAVLGLKATLEQDEKGFFVKANIRRKAITAAGKPMQPPRVVDAKLKPLTADIGWGSTGNVEISVKAGDDGIIRGMLDGMQVITLKAPPPSTSLFEEQEADTVMIEPDTDDGGFSEEPEPVAATEGGGATIESGSDAPVDGIY